MFIRPLKSREEIVAGDRTLLREVLHGPKDQLALGYSLAHARLAAGETSRLHQLAVSEVYYLLSGHGRMEIDGQVQDVSAGDTVYIPPGAAQRISNVGSGDLSFLCIVDPAWRAENERVTES